MRGGGSLGRKQALVLLGIATVVFWLGIGYLDRKMEAAGGPSILGFEFAGSERQAAKIMAEWGAGGRDYARWSLWLDYGFMLSYGGFFALAAAATRDFAGATGRRRLAAVGIVAPFAALAAACFDAIENACLLLTLGGHGGDLAALIATASASLKFALIVFAIAYVVAGLLTRLLRSRRVKG